MNLERSLDIIGIVPKNLTIDKVKSNYHKLTLIHHPDKGGDNDFYCILGDANRFLIKYIESGHKVPTTTQATTTASASTYASASD